MTLTFDAKRKLDELELDEELKDVLSRVYPSEEQDRAVRAKRIAHEQRQAQADALRRNKMCENALAGDYGGHVKAQAAAIYAEAGSLTDGAMAKILRVIRDSGRAT
jgi:hypothetical protein